MMIKKHDLLKNVLIDVEEGVRNGIKTDIIAKKHTLSESHLHRLFRLAYNQPLGFYIRSRKLLSSINDIVNTNLTILDIALCYGYKYEQSYIKAFKQKFGLTPGFIRKKGKNAI